MGRDLGYTVLAEGVETIEQHDLLAQVGSTLFQGYLYGKPMALADFGQRIEVEAKMLGPNTIARGRPG
ncbi:EAL domain-containing protein [Devosia algicola]|uniref:EAL domain-containing protein n=1 Tax=Devosia algicola TaxID=3026418 RepID=A0ABY7YTI0_9HYPH|nr:EAL domain-containing protein [Devosia algicola]WDR04345.1 EAL domain-containing protein [Devosia algicola]